MLTSRIFNNLQEFQSYCKENFKTYGAGHPCPFPNSFLINLPCHLVDLTTQGLFSGTLFEHIKPTLRNYVERTPTEDKIYQLENIFAMLLAPLGLWISLHNAPKNTPLTDLYLIKGNLLKVTLPDQGHLALYEPTTIAVIASEFFLLMAATGQSQFDLNRNTKLVFLGLNNKVVTNLTPEEAFDLIKEYSLHSGFHISSSGSAKMTFAGPTLRITNPVSLSLSISPTENYQYTTSAFIKTLLLKPNHQLEIPANVQLKIEGNEIVIIRQSYKKSWSLFPCTPPYEPFFILQQLFLHWGYRLTFTSIPELSLKNVKSNLEPNTVTFESPSQFTISLIPGTPTEIDLKILHLTMTLSGGRRTITIPANTETLFSDLEIPLLDQSKSIIPLTNAIQETFQSKITFGLNWQIAFSTAPNTEVSHRSIVNSNGKWLEIKSNAPIELSLTLPKKPAQFAISILEYNHLSIAKSLFAKNEKAIQTFLFQSIFHFCFEKFYRLGFLQIPSHYFKTETTTEIQKTITDPTFLEHLDNCIKNNFQIITEIQNVSPERFDQLMNTPDPSGAFIINRVQEIASVERQGGSPYIEETIHAITKKLSQLIHKS